jgi:hypothetical protein
MTEEARMSSKITVFKNGRKVRGKSTARRPRVVGRARQTAFITGHKRTAEEILAEARDRVTAAALPEEPAASPGATIVDERVGGPINHPKHYNEHPSGVECISIIRWETGNLAAAIKYIWRIRSKPLLKQIEDLKKAEFYLHDEIERLEGIARDGQAKVI